MPTSPPAAGRITTTMHIALLVATVLAATANWWSRLREDARLEQWSKPTTTVLVIGLALVSGAPHRHVVLAVIALVLCLAGDIALMPVVDNFVAGLASFLLGHMVFIVLFVSMGLHHPRLAGIAIILAALLTASAGRIIVGGAARQTPALRVPVLAYLMVISSMAAFGWATGNWWVVTGSTLFVVSDAVLGWRQFVRERPWMGLTVMVTYHGAIAALALSLW
jgi:uncharacterized membrane protein YhhN